MRSTDYISKGTAVARLYKAREYLGMPLNAKASKVVVLKCVFAFKVPLIAKAQNCEVLKSG